MLRHKEFSCICFGPFKINQVVILMKYRSENPTIGYLQTGFCPDRIKNIFPRPRLIAILINPGNVFQQKYMFYSVITWCRWEPDTALFSIHIYEYYNQIRNIPIIIILFANNNTSISLEVSYEIYGDQYWDKKQRHCWSYSITKLFCIHEILCLNRKSTIKVCQEFG